MPDMQAATPLPHGPVDDCDACNIVFDWSYDSDAEPDISAAQAQSTPALPITPQSSRVGQSSVAQNQQPLQSIAGACEADSASIVSDLFMSPICTTTYKPLSAVETVHIFHTASPTLSDLSAPYYPPNLPRERFKDYTSLMRFLPLMDASVYLKHSERLYSSPSRAHDHGRAVTQPIRHPQDARPRRALGSTARTNVPKGTNAPHHHKNKHGGKPQHHRGHNRQHAKTANRNRERPARPLPPRMRNMAFPAFDMSRQPSFEHCTVGWGSQMEPARDGRGVRRG